MGRFEPGYLEGQRCYLAWVDGTLVGFVSFHETENEWALDLMRSSGDMPDGAMHAVIVNAVQDARTAGVGRLSLAAMPLSNPPPVLRFLSARREAQGLRRFKLSFAPNTRRLYLAAPGVLTLAVAGIDILARISRPPVDPPAATPDDAILTGYSAALAPVGPDRPMQ